MDQLVEVARTCIRVFLATLLGFVITSSVGIWEWDTWAEWKGPIGAATVAACAVLVKALDPSADEYGIRAQRG